jgi:hypothetical protein
MMSFRKDLRAAWRLQPGAPRAAGQSRDGACAFIRLHDPAVQDQPVGRQWSAPRFVGAGARRVGDALLLGAVLMRFFGFVVPLIVRHYFDNLWRGPLREGRPERRRPSPGRFPRRVMPRESGIGRQGWHF